MSLYVRNIRRNLPEGVPENVSENDPSDEVMSDREEPIVYPPSIGDSYNSRFVQC